MKVGIKLVKVKKFGIGWSIPHRVVAENAEGGFVQIPPPHGIGLIYQKCGCGCEVRPLQIGGAHTCASKSGRARCVCVRPQERSQLTPC